MLDGLVRFVVGSFEFAVRLVLGIGLVMEAAVGEGATEALVKKQEQERDLYPLVSKPVGITAAIALEESVAFELAQIVAELVQTIGSGRELERSENRLVDLFGGPTADGGAAVQEDFHQANDSGIVDLDSGIANRADGSGQCQALQQRGKSTCTFRHWA